MTHEEKIEWMAVWAAKNGLQLNLEGECGFGRKCVGILAEGSYPDYKWYNDETYEEEDKNGDVWIPEDAYHKHECVAVLGRGEEAESQLYDWLKWFDKNNFELEASPAEMNPKLGAIGFMLGKHINVRMVKQ